MFREIQHPCFGGASRGMNCSCVFSCEHFSAAPEQNENWGGITGVGCDGLDFPRSPFLAVKKTAAAVKPYPAGPADDGQVDDLLSRPALRLRSGRCAVASILTKCLSFLLSLRPQFSPFPKFAALLTSDRPTDLDRPRSRRSTRQGVRALICEQQTQRTKMDDEPCTSNLDFKTSVMYEM